jgi:hypothetical protein
MDAAARAKAVENLVRDSGALSDNIEIVRARQVGDRITVLARWVDARSGHLRRGAVDVIMEDGVWRASAGWSSNADHDSDHPVWRDWGGTRRSMSGWVWDPAGATVRFRDPDGRVEADTVESGVAILMYDTAFGRASVVEVLDDDGNVLQSAPLYPS